MDESESLHTQIAMLTKQVLQEQLGRLAAEANSFETMRALYEVRVPQIKMEVSLAQAKLKELNNGPAGHK